MIDERERTFKVRIWFGTIAMDCGDVQARSAKDAALAVAKRVRPPRHDGQDTVAEVSEGEGVGYGFGSGPRGGPDDNAVRVHLVARRRLVWEHASTSRANPSAG